MPPWLGLGFEPGSGFGFGFGFGFGLGLGLGFELTPRLLVTAQLLQLYLDAVLGAALQRL